MENQDYVVLFEKEYSKNYLENDCFGNFVLFGNRYHVMRTAGQTQKVNKEKYFLFLILYLFIFIFF